MYSTGVTCLYSFSEAVLTPYSKSEAVLIPYSKSEAYYESVSNQNHQDPRGLGDHRSSDGAGSDKLYRHAGDNEHSVVRPARRHNDHDHDEDGGDLSR